MVWIKLGILIIGFIYAGLIPFTVRRVVRQIDFDLHEQTLSFLSNKTLYDKKFRRGYTRLLFVTAVLHYVFSAALQVLLIWANTKPTCDT